MDPNTALEIIRQAIRYDGPMADADRIEMITEHFTALDQWLTNGGFLPTAWSHVTTGRPA